MTMTAEQGALFPAGDGHAGVLGGVPFDPSAVLRSLRPGVDAGQVRAALGRFTPQQLNVVHHVVNSARNVMVVATAGSGKSTVLRTTAQVLPGGLTIGAFALNRSIAQELRGALPGDVQVSTFHAFGRRLVEEHCPVQATFVEWKRLNIVKAILKEAGAYSAGVAKSLLSLVRLSMVHIANSADAVLALAAEQEFEFPAGLDVVGAVRAVQDRALSDFRTRGHFDYDDMLYLPLKLGYGFESLDVALVDEAQDVSRLQHRLVRHVVGRRGRVIFVGDDRQTTHGCSGADKGGLTHAAEVFGAATGEVLRVTEEEVLPELRPGDLVICRMNAPMLSMATRLVQEGVPVEVLGHDLVKAMEGHVRRCFAYSFAPDEVEGRLHEYGMSLLQSHDESGLRGKVLRRAVEADMDLPSCVAVPRGMDPFWLVGS
jgi:DNA helicase-2/ATP-dependent DNA helicase PcrA